MFITTITTHHKFTDHIISPSKLIEHDIISKAKFEEDLKVKVSD